MDWDNKRQPIVIVLLLFVHVVSIIGLVYAIAANQAEQKESMLPSAERFVQQMVSLRDRPSLLNLDQQRAVVSYCLTISDLNLRCSKARESTSHAVDDLVWFFLGMQIIAFSLVLLLEFFRFRDKQRLQR